MVLPFLPDNRTQALALLRAVDDEIDQLTPEQRARLRELYYLDDPRSVADRIRSGEVIS